MSQKDKRQELADDIASLIVSLPEFPDKQRVRELGNRIEEKYGEDVAGNIVTAGLLVLDAIKKV